MYLHIIVNNRTSLDQELDNIHIQVGPVCLPKTTQDFSGVTAVAAGWGRTDKADINKEQSVALKEVDLEVSAKTYKAYKMFGTKLEKNDYGTYKDACSGDSGSHMINHHRNSFKICVLQEALLYIMTPNMENIYLQVKPLLDI